MNIAGALAERAALDEKIRSLQQRAKGAARYLEGEEPPENAAELLGLAVQAMTERRALISRINLTNAATELEPGMTLTAALAQRALLSAHAALLHAIADEASPGRDPYGRGRRKTELPEKTDIPVKDLRAEADRLSREHRELDARIQQKNWNTELI